MQFIVPLKKKNKETETGYDLDLLLDLNVTIFFFREILILMTKVVTKYKI